MLFKINHGFDKAVRSERPERLTSSRSICRSRAAHTLLNLLLSFFVFCSYKNITRKRIWYEVIIKHRIRNDCRTLSENTSCAAKRNPTTTRVSYRCDAADSNISLGVLFFPWANTSNQSTKHVIKIPPTNEYELRPSEVFVDDLLCSEI